MPMRSRSELVNQVLRRALRQLLQLPATECLPVHPGRCQPKRLVPALCAEDLKTKFPMVRPLSADSDRWAFATDQHRRVPRGKTDMLKG
jgi:hypothetical protein